MAQALGLKDIILMNIVAVVSLRWLSSAASSGPSSLSLWVLATLFFFIPQGLAVADLSARYPGEGGLYRWTQTAFGDGHGFLCGWCYWVNNLIYFPGLLLFVSANLSFAAAWLNPEWQFEGNKTFAVAITLISLWLVALLSLVGLRTGKWLQNLGGFANWIPAVIVVILAPVGVLYFGSANEISLRTIVPNLAEPEKLSFFAQMCFALAGLELVSFLGSEIRNPEKTITRAVIVTGVIISIVYLVGTIGILVTVPQEKITAVNGLLMPMAEVGKRIGAGWLAGVTAILIATAGIGGVFAWFNGSSRVPYVVGVDRYLPSAFGKLHPRFGTPHIAILVQLGLATAFTLFATGGSTSLENAYKILVDMCLILYFIPYCYLFLSIIWLRGEKPVRNVLAGLAGFATTVLAIVTTVFPPGNGIDWALPLKTALGTLFMLGVGGGLYLFGRRIKTAPGAGLAAG